VQEFYYLFVVFLALIIPQNTLKVSIHAALRFVQQPLFYHLHVVLWTVIPSDFGQLTTSISGQFALAITLHQKKSFK
jgi:hypothetical protein